MVTFLSAVWLFWWSFPLANAAWYVKCLDLQGRRNDIYEWWAPQSLCTADAPLQIFSPRRMQRTAPSAHCPLSDGLVDYLGPPPSPPLPQSLPSCALGASS